MIPYSFLERMNCENRTDYCGKEANDVAHVETVEEMKHGGAMDLSLSGYKECNGQASNSFKEIVKHREVLNSDDRIKDVKVTEIISHADNITEELFIEKIKHHERDNASNQNLNLVDMEDDGLGEKMKCTDLTNNAISNKENPILLPNDISNVMMTPNDQKMYPFSENMVNGDINSDPLVEKLRYNDIPENSLSEKRKYNDMEDGSLDESTEMLLTSRSPDVGDRVATGDDFDDTDKNTNYTGEDSGGESGGEMVNSRIDALNDSMDSLESSARQWQTSAIKLGMVIFDKPATSWKSCTSLLDGKVGIRLQRKKIEDSFSIKSISNNSFSFHSNLTLHSEDPMLEQKVAILEEVQNKQNKDIHSCDMCPREFTKANQLKLHMKTHTGAIKAYQCHDCCQRFKVNLELTEPFSNMFQREMLLKASAPPSSFPGFHDISGPMPRILSSSTVKLAKDIYCVGNLLGEGGFAKVYSAYWGGGPESCQDAVLKVQLGGSPDWEWYITNQVQSRIRESNHPDLGSGLTWQSGYMYTPSCYIYNTGHILVSQQQHLGTLLDMVNLMRDMDKNLSIEMAEPVAIYLIAELLGLVEYLHSVDIVHADIKPDNFLLRFIPNRSNLHKSPCLQLIDFGKSLDLRLLPENTVFDEVLMETDLLKCVEMREGRPWMHHIDYFGVAGIAYCLLFGGYINNNIVKIGGRWGIKGAVYKRWWQVEWKMFFDDLLNVKGASKECLPSLVSWRNKLLSVFREKNMADHMEQLEEHLEMVKRGRQTNEQTQGKTPAKKRRKH